MASVRTLIKVEVVFESHAKRDFLAIRFCRHKFDLLSSFNTALIESMRKASDNLNVSDLARFCKHRGKYESSSYLIFSSFRRV